MELVDLLELIFLFIVLLFLGAVFLTFFDSFFTQKVNVLEYVTIECTNESSYNTYTYMNTTNISVYGYTNLTISNDTNTSVVVNESMVGYHVSGGEGSFILYFNFSLPKNLSFFSSYANWSWVTNVTGHTFFYLHAGSSNSTNGTTLRSGFSSLSTNTILTNITFFQHNSTHYGVQGPQGTYYTLPERQIYFKMRLHTNSSWLTHSIRAVSFFFNGSGNYTGNYSVMYPNITGATWLEMNITLPENYTETDNYFNFTHLGNYGIHSYLVYANDTLLHNSTSDYTVNESFDSITVSISFYNSTHYKIMGNTNSVYFTHDSVLSIRSGITTFGVNDTWRNISMYIAGTYDVYGECINATKLMFIEKEMDNRVFGVYEDTLALFFSWFGVILAIGLIVFLLKLIINVG